MIDERAAIDSKATIGKDVEIGPFSVIGADVTIGDGCKIGPHVVITGPTTIGKNNEFYQFASIGAAPQDKKYAGEPTTLTVGDDNIFREGCTVHRGTSQDRGDTAIGNGNLIMAYVHIAHDCVVGNHTIFANGASLAGHVYVDDYAILGGYTLVHQFCRLGLGSFTSFGTGINQDVPPYVMVAGHRGEPKTINVEGLKRRKFPEQSIKKIRQAYKVLYKSSLKLDEALEQITEMSDECEELKPMVEFISTAKRGIIR